LPQGGTLLIIQLADAASGSHGGSLHSAASAAIIIIRSSIPNNICGTIQTILCGDATTIPGSGGI
jgi:hypothetical protein